MCGFPVTIKNPLWSESAGMGVQRYMQVGCNKCVECCNRRADQWYIRLHYEYKTAFSGYFVTLTYQDPPRTFNGLFTASIDDLKGYWKRLRKRDGNNTEIKYYACHEYGEDKQRPHYHAIVFNVRDRNNLIRAWSLTNPKTRDVTELGNVHIGDVEPASIRYVTGYIGKRIGIPLDDYDDRLPEKSYMSKNMGLYYLDHVAMFNLKNMVGYTVLDGKKFNLPRYYKLKIFDDAQRKIISHQNQVSFYEARDRKKKTFGSELAFDKNEREVTIANNRNRPIITKSPFYQ